jgi:hypothetical protein
MAAENVDERKRILQPDATPTRVLMRHQSGWRDQQ